MSTLYKIPESVLVVIHDVQLNVLLLERADAPGYWQSVTGSKDHVDEAFAATAQREVWEETGIDCRATGCLLSDWHQENIYDIYVHYRWRYAPGVTRNTERVFGLRVPAGIPVRTSPQEHLAYRWLPWTEAARACGSASNQAAIECLATRRFGAL